MTERKIVVARVITNPDSVPPLTLDADVPFAVQGDSYVARFWGVGGAGGYSYTVNSAPAWLSDATVGGVLELTGTVPYGGDGDIVVTVTDALLDAGSRTFHVTVGGTIRPPGWGGSGQVRGVQPITIETIKGGDFNYDVVAACSGVTLPIVGLFQVDGTLPGHSAVDDVNGTVYGTSVTAAGEFLFTLRLEDAAGQVIDLPFKVVVKEQMALTSELPDALVGQSYTGRITATGGSGDYSYEVTAGALPDGMLLDPKSGLFHPKGLPTTPSAADTPSSFTVTATDSYGNSASLACAITVTRGQRSLAAGRVHLGAVDESGAPVASDLFLSFFGTGADGDFTCNGSNTHPAITNTVMTGGVTVAVAQRDCHFNNLTLVAGGRFDPNGFNVFVAGVLDLTDCIAGAIATYSTASGAAPYGTTPAGVGGTGVVASNPATSLGGNAVRVRCAGGGKGGGIPGLPGSSNTGRGGSGSTGVGGFGGLNGAIDVYRYPSSVFQADVSALDYDAVLKGYPMQALLGGTSGAGGGGGAGNGTTAGGNGGKGGNAGGLFRLFVRTIRRGKGTPSGAIHANGLNGSAGSPGGGTNRGGGGGGAGGGGGRVWICYLTLEGDVATACVTANGGQAGNGGAAGGSSGLAGQGNTGGDSGSITLISLSDASASSTTVGTAGSANSGSTGGAGGVCEADL